MFNAIAIAIAIGWMTAKALPNQTEPNQAFLGLFTGVFDPCFLQKPPKPTRSDLTEQSS